MALALLAAPIVDGHGLGVSVLPNGPPAAPSASTPLAPTTTPTGVRPVLSLADPDLLLPAPLVPETRNMVAVDAGLGWVNLMDEAPGDPALQFWCPGVDGGTSVQNGYNTLTMRMSCPYRIVDDADLLGSPQIAVNLQNPNEVAFFSLHGGGSTDGPTPRSRDPSPDGTNALTALSHTTFTSTDEGRAWFDNPWGNDGFGEHASGVMDRDGNMYIAALWSKPAGRGAFDYHFKLYKEDSAEHALSTYSPSKTVSNRAAGNIIPEVNLVFVPGRVIPLPDDGTGNETDSNATRPADASDVGNATVPEPPAQHGEDRVVAVWFEKAFDYTNTSTGKSSWIDAMWSDTSSRNNWTRLDDSQLIGPCMDASNPVTYDGKVYVACVADAGYRGRARAKIGQIDVWQIDPETGDSSVVAYSGITGGRPRMTGRPDGYMALSSVNVPEPTKVDLKLTFGWYGKYWTGPSNSGQFIHEQLAGGSPVREARVTAMALEAEKNVLFMSYLERREPGVRPPEPNPSTLNLNPTGSLEYFKSVMTFTQCQNFPLDAYDLQVGVVRHPFQDGVVGDATGAFDDLQDGMELYVDDAGNERVYFAYGDHGVIQYGALVGNSGLAPPCPIYPPPPTIPPPPVPAAASTASPYTIGIGSAVGLVSLAMVTYLLAVKRKTAAYAVAKDKR